MSKRFPNPRLGPADEPRPSLPVRAVNNPRVRAVCIQVAVFAVLVFALAAAVFNTAHNLRKAGIASGFEFLGHVSGFDIGQSLIEYSRSSTYARVFVVGLLNTLLVSTVSIFFSTLIGFFLGILRLSPNWLLNRMALVYVEVVRNVPLLLQVFFWYIAILSPLPGPRQAIDFFGAVFLCNRGLIIPRPVLDEGSRWVILAVVVAVVGVVGLKIWGDRRQRLTGRRAPVLLLSLLLVAGLPMIAMVATGYPVRWELPNLKGFNFLGGITLQPEFTALVLALTLYTAGFIAENVRAGIQAVPTGQIEAARSLGFRPGKILRLVVIPQAMRVIIPPLTSQHLTLVKNSSLAVVIGYPDLMAVFAGTALNQTGQAVEIIAITMLVYLVISLVISAVMNVYDRKMAIRER
ncbi:MAG: amino acid ABC transporter permease [Deltaproteobacteria bacterium]|nr:amino acid ABC transporter permease [Deltaproteobacteria bacterium]